MGKSKDNTTIQTKENTQVTSFLTSAMLPTATTISKWTQEVARSQVDLVTPCFKAMHNVTMMLSPVIAEIEEKKGYQLLGYKNMDELASSEWGISHGTLVNARKIFGRFGEKDNEGRNVIKDRWTDFGARKLLLLTTASQSVINNVSPDMTYDDIKEMINPITVVIEPQEHEDDENTTTSLNSGENTNISESGDKATTTSNSGENTTKDVNVDKAPEYTLRGICTVTLTVIENFTSKLNDEDKTHIMELHDLLSKVMESVENGNS